MDPKAPYLSKTLWTNLIVAAVAFFPAAQSYVSAHPLAIVEAFAVVNFVLRLVTKNAISLNDPTP